MIRERDAFVAKLAEAYHRGTLVPFIGAGMSMGHAPGWADLVARLEKSAKIPVSDTAESRKPDALVARAEKAVRVLRRVSGGLQGAVRSAVYASSSPEPFPSQSKALGTIRWPLVLTTNYEDYFYRAARDSKGGYAFKVLGRKHARRVLASLSSLDEPILWALQGFIPGDDKTSELEDLSDELVVGHAEYRRVAHADIAFRRSFAEVFRRRSLLFLGSGLSERYFLDLFEEIAELHGENPAPHFAIAPRGLDVAALRERYGIHVLEYPEDMHSEVPEILDALKEKLKSGPHIGPTEWRFQVPGKGTDQLEFVLRRRDLKKADLKESDKTPRAVMVSAGRKEGMRIISSGIQKGLDSVDWSKSAPLHSSSGSVMEHGSDTKNLLVLSVCPWKDDDSRDLTLISEVLADALTIVDERALAALQMTLLGSGDSAEFPREYSLAAMLRTIGRWYRERPARALKSVTIYIRDREVGAAIAAERLVPAALLSGGDMPFVVEVCLPDGRAERRFAEAGEDRLLTDFAQLAGIRASGWVAGAIPQFRAPVPVRLDDRQTKIGDVGVIPGSTLQFRLGEKPT